MRQALHIFKKDIRHLWIEIAVTLLVVAAFTFTSARRAGWLADPAVNTSMATTLVKFLLPLVWCILIARLVHADPVCGRIGCDCVYHHGDGAGRQRLDESSRDYQYHQRDDHGRFDLVRTNYFPHTSVSLKYWNIWRSITDQFNKIFINEIKF